MKLNFWKKEPVETEIKICHFCRYNRETFYPRPDQVRPALVDFKSDDLVVCTSCIADALKYVMKHKTKKEKKHGKIES